MRNRSLALSATVLCLVAFVSGHATAENIYQPFETLPSDWTVSSSVRTDELVADPSAASMRIDEHGDLIVSLNLPSVAATGMAIPGVENLLWTPYRLRDGHRAEVEVVVGELASGDAYSGIVLSMPAGVGRSEEYEIRWEISHDGRWSRAHFTGGILQFAWSSLHNRSPYIALGPGDVNKLALEIDGCTIRFVINGYQVDVYESASLLVSDDPSAGLGLICSVFASEPVSHDFVVRSLKLYDPSSLPSGVPLPYEESFDSVFTGWPDAYHISDGQQLAYSTHQEDEYVLAVTGGMSLWANAPVESPEGSWVAAADFYHPVTAGNPAYGLRWTTSTGKQYICYVTPFGQYTLSWRNRGSTAFTLEVPFTDGGFLTGSQQNTRLELASQGNALAIYANGVELHSMIDPERIEEIGVILESYDASESCSVHLTRFSIVPLELAASAAMLDDSFASTETGWQTESTGQLSSGYVDGRYLLRIEPVSQTYWSVAPIDGMPAHFDVAVTAGRASGPLDGYYGIILGIDEDDILFLQVSADGWYLVEWLADGQWQPALVDWTESAIVRTGDAANRLLVRVSETSIAFMVNDEELTSVPVPGVSFASAGLVASTYENPGFEAWFDDFLVTIGD